MTEVRPATLPVTRPTVTSETRPFWDAIADGRFVLARCRECSTVIWYPRGFCAGCASTETIEWVPASGKGTVYSFTVIRKGRGPWDESVPYVAAYVELAEGPRVLTNLVDVGPDAVSIGQPVEVVIEEGEDGARLYRFRPSKG
ncbi:MAG: Zn-ribbon domain-containing OB-fold protein [Acidimicrobiales bacterium]